MKNDIYFGGKCQQLCFSRYILTFSAAFSLNQTEGNLDESLIEEKGCRRWTTLAPNDVNCRKRNKDKEFSSENYVVQERGNIVHLQRQKVYIFTLLSDEWLPKTFCATN